MTLKSAGALSQSCLSILMLLCLTCQHTRCSSLSVLCVMLVCTCHMQQDLFHYHSTGWSTECNEKSKHSVSLNMTYDLISLELYLMVLTLTLMVPAPSKLSKVASPLWSPCPGLVLYPSPLLHPTAVRHDPLTPLLCCTFVPVWIFHIAVAAGAWCRTELSLCTRV